MSVFGWIHSCTQVVAISVFIWPHCCTEVVALSVCLTLQQCLMCVSLLSLWHGCVQGKLVPITAGLILVGNPDTHGNSIHF